MSIQRLQTVLGSVGPVIVACSGGIDSLLLATVSHRSSSIDVIVAHAVGPAVPEAATIRVEEWARREGWNLRLVRSGEFEDQNYLSNPVDRCYYCKSHLYSSLASIAKFQLCNDTHSYTVVSGANIDDLKEYRPGLEAARESGVRHPYIEAGIEKATIREIARHLNLPFSELPASPCLASRLYTGTRVTKQRLAAIEQGEELIRKETGVTVVRCRIRENQMLVEISGQDRSKLHTSVLTKLEKTVSSILPEISEVTVDPLPYRPGRAFLVAS